MLVFNDDGTIYTPCKIKGIYRNLTMHRKLTAKIIFYKRDCLPEPVCGKINELQTRSSSFIQKSLRRRKRMRKIQKAVISSLLSVSIMIEAACPMNYVRADETKIEEDVDLKVMQDKDIANLLLIGQDRREGEDRQRSDTIIICSINKEEKKIILSSVMRDLYVPIPGYSDNRINAAYQFGGMELLDQVLEESLGIKIDGNIEVDFDGFIESLSALGNLDIELNAEEAAYMNLHSVVDSGEQWYLQEGVNSMTPEQVLNYSRNRFVGNSDWERTERQRKVLTAAFDKAKDMSLFKLLELAGSILPNVTTDIGTAKILGYVYSVFSIGIDEVESYQIPVNGTYSCETLSMGMEVLVPDLTANSKYLKEYIYGKPVDVTEMETEA